MAKDLLGNPVGGRPAAFELSLQQKRQAALLYHWMSMDYLQRLKDMIESLISGADVGLALAQRQGRDALLANARWGVRDTAANWSTYGFPALQDFRLSTLRLIAQRAAEGYCGTGANQCARMLSEFSVMWMTPDEEERFSRQAQAVYRYASFIDYAAGVGGARTHLDDYTMHLHWRAHAALFPRLPGFRVRTDVVGVSGKRPPRTGVYVPQDDPYGTLQFAWRGNEDGLLGDAQTFNDVGLRMVSAVGYPSLWTDESRMASFAFAEWARNPGLDASPYTLEKVKADPSSAGNAMAFVVFKSRPCDWYFVERLEGEFDDEADSSAIPAKAAPALRCEAGQPCPMEGWWSTPAKAGSRRRFAAGELMPSMGGDYGTTIWQMEAGEGD